MSSTERLTRGSIALDVGSRVTTGVGVAKKGVISFIGETHFAAGEWLGLTLDNPDGKNDGSSAGVSYFVCKPLHGVFVKRVSIHFVLSSIISKKILLPSNINSFISTLFVISCCEIVTL